MNPETIRSRPCPICGAAAGEPCREEGPTLAAYHVGRVTGGAPLRVVRAGAGLPWRAQNDDAPHDGGAG
jgi:hypothetical protein